MDYGYHHRAAPTSRDHYRTFDASGLYKVILNHMEENRDRPFCIADLANELGLERSTVSARMNELKQFGKIAYAGKAQSRATGVTAMQWRLPVKETLF